MLVTRMLSGVEQRLSHWFDMAVYGKDSEKRLIHFQRVFIFLYIILGRPK